ncbi:hypothetical protein KK083_03650 [Fulvivirgaceae bacterium PWU4]|uniref:Uncharacterized protein n=1 Tax=Chryseosolibacter histidini TaxID=2782349 RepID=A0AAP2DGI8_9BACT|nr:hypothetical protein [Chryseosolibacter histidini]MBT1695956.1 hypothetical protein [Chryseosolibacter histidini]
MVVTKAHVLFLLVLALFISCSGQTSKQKEIYNEEFKWSISIPADFENVSDAEGKKMQDKGISALEKPTDSPLRIRRSQFLYSRVVS